MCAPGARGLGNQVKEAPCPHHKLSPLPPPRLGQVPLPQTGSAMMGRRLSGQGEWAGCAGGASGGCGGCAWSPTAATLRTRGSSKWAEPAPLPLLQTVPRAPQDTSPQATTRPAGPGPSESQASGAGTGVLGAACWPLPPTVAPTSPLSLLPLAFLLGQSRVCEPPSPKVCEPLTHPGGRPCPWRAYMVRVQVDQKEPMWGAA